MIQIAADFSKIPRFNSLAVAIKMISLPVAGDTPFCKAKSSRV